jgi:hypothetical protein
VVTNDCYTDSQRNYYLKDNIDPAWKSIVGDEMVANYVATVQKMVKDTIFRLQDEMEWVYEQMKQGAQDA